MGLCGLHGTRTVRRGRSLLQPRQPTGDSDDSELVQEGPPDPKRGISRYGMIGMLLGTLGLHLLQPARSRLHALKLR